MKETHFRFPTSSSRQRQRSRENWRRRRVSSTRALVVARPRAHSRIVASSPSAPKAVAAAHRRAPRDGMSSAETDVSELGGLPGAPPPPLGPPLEVPKMGPGDVVLLEMNGEKWAFVNLKRGQCVPARSPRPHVFDAHRESGARRVAAAAARETERLPLQLD
mmetsp:Transcript_12322/g.51579  ORF Transcript_12322/g.51579 Transcript_12322/m.51579 type:complete len:162 (-) Transcript_12322:2622-3107(-)